ncbi:MAG: histidinol-phosphate transaminase [Thermodesulfobacteriota bacterium]|nr:histidinol-phosphate transaminase [Thermodesulfobacteriota bacterium]
MNTNENPYPPSPEVIEAIKQETNNLIRRYPPSLADSLLVKASEVFNIDPDRIIAGNGCDEILSIITRSIVGPGDRVLIFTPTYTLYKTLVNIQDGNIIDFQYQEDFRLPESGFPQDTRLTFLCNPHSPSGVFCEIDKVSDFAKKLKGILVLDEAYVDFAEDNGLRLLKKHENVIILRSMSKSFSLAGMRIGFAMAQKPLIEQLLKVKDSYNLNRVSIRAGIAALNDISWMKKNRKQIIDTRNRLTSFLMNEGFVVYSSQANFVLARMPGKSLKNIYEKLKEKKIFVRYFNTSRLYDCIRITVGDNEEVNELIVELKKLMKKSII